jgi:hypothetical protein
MNAILIHFTDSTGYRSVDIESASCLEDHIARIIEDHGAHDIKTTDLGADWDKAVAVYNTALAS